MIRQAQLESKGTRQKVLSYIGMVFRHSLQAPDWYLDTAVADFLIRYASYSAARHAINGLLWFITVHAVATDCIVFV